MRDKVRDPQRLKHMLLAIDTITKSFSLYDKKNIESDPIIFYGFVKHLEIMGEAAYMLTKDFKENHPEIDWRVIEGLRHVLVHGYYKIRPTEIFNTITDDIPLIRIQIKSLLDSIE